MAARNVYFYNQAIRQTLDDVFEAAFDRNICGYRKYELAMKAGLSYSTIYKLERGATREPRFSTILKLCRAVNMDMTLARQGLGVVGRKKRKIA